MASFEYRCTDCGRTFSRDEVRYLCPVCGPAYKPGIPLLGVLEAVFDYDGIRDAFDRAHPDWNLFCPVEPRFHPPIPVGNTPLARVDRLGTDLGLDRLWVKNDGLNPSGSLKDRASFLVAAEARRLGIDLIVAASTGNAASALAAVCASSGQQALIFVPQTAPKAKLVQMVLYGAKVVPVKGTYDDAFRLSLDYTAQRGGLNRNTAYHPLTLEGKKTAGLEIWAQLGFQAPDAVVVSVGDGVILGGVHKGFLDLQAGRPDRPPAPADRRPGGDLRRHPPLRPDRPVLRRRQPDHPRRLHLGHLPQQRPRRAPGHAGKRRAHPHRHRRGDPVGPGRGWRPAPASSPSPPAPPPWPAWPSCRPAPGAWPQVRPGGDPGHRPRPEGRGGAPFPHQHPPRHRTRPGGRARMRTLIRNGRAALADRIQDADVLVEDGRIAAVGRLGAVGADRVIDASGCYVLPGLMDFHTHVDDQIGRFYLADTYESGTRVALQNGITTLCTFVTQDPGQSLAQAMADRPGQGRGPQPLRRALAPHPHHLRAGRPGRPGGAPGGRLPDPQALHHLQGRRDLRQLRADRRPVPAPGPHGRALHGPLRGRRGHRLGRPRRGRPGPGRTATPCCAPRRPRSWRSGGWWSWRWRAGLPCTWCTSPPWTAPGTWCKARPRATSPSRPAPSTWCWTIPGWPGPTATAGCARRPCAAAAARRCAGWSGTAAPTSWPPTTAPSAPRTRTTGTAPTCARCPTASPASARCPT